MRSGAAALSRTGAEGPRAADLEGRWLSGPQRKPQIPAGLGPGPRLKVCACDVHTVMLTGLPEGLGWRAESLLPQTTGLPAATCWLPPSSASPVLSIPPPGGGSVAATHHRSLDREHSGTQTAAPPPCWLPGSFC